MLYIAPGVNRTMSIASPPPQKNSITLIHDVSPMGMYSKWTLAAKVGDPMEFMGPLGVFMLDRESHRNKIFVATGTGVAPFYGMGVDYLSSGGTDDVTLYWGLRCEEDIFWQKEFEQLMQKYPNFRFVLTLSQPAESWQGKRGHVQDYVFSQLNHRDADYYMCGNRVMTDDMRAKLKDAGVPDTQVKFELFY